jgi:hypothetical protein
MLLIIAITANTPARVRLNVKTTGSDNLGKVNKRDMPW